MQYFDYPQQGEHSAEKITVFNDLGEDEWGMIIRNARSTQGKRQSFGSLRADESTQSYSRGGLTQKSWAHVLCREGKLLGGVFINRPQAANALISASKKMDAIFTAEQIIELLAQDEKIAASTD